MITEVLDRLRHRDFAAADAVCDPDADFMDPRSDLVIELVRVAPALPAPVLKILVRAIGDGAIAAARPALDRYRRKQPDRAEDSRRCLEARAPTLHAEVGAWLEMVEVLPARHRKYIVVTVVVFVLGLLWGLAFDDDEDAGDAPATITVPRDTKLCVGDKHGIKSLQRCE